MNLNPDKEVDKIHNLILKNKPKQFELISDLKNHFLSNINISELLIRGSIAEGTCDRLSDIDFVIACRDDSYIDLVESLDEFLNSKFDILFPGWYDSIVPDFGGLGFVYLLFYDSKIYQLDVYVLPNSQVSSMKKRILVKSIFKNNNISQINTPAEKNIDFCKRFSKNGDITENIFIESLIIGFLVYKRIHRSQYFLNFCETKILLNSYKNLIRSRYDPKYLQYGWYKLENLHNHDEGKVWLKSLKKFIEKSTIQDLESLGEFMREILKFIHVNEPKVISKYEKSINRYYTYTSFGDFGINEKIGQL
jgi:predicted nucleotidyltransferase